MQDTGIKGWRYEDEGFKDIGYSRFIRLAAWWPLYEGPADLYIYIYIYSPGENIFIHLAPERIFFTHLAPGRIFLHI